MKENGFDYNNLPHNHILCIDMKAFYASVEAVERGLDPLKAKLVVIGDKSRKGSVVLAASPVVKEKYSIKTGNRLFQIPETADIKLVEARMSLYLKRSMQITELLNQFVPLEDLHIYSVDEAWLKLDGVEKIFGDKWEIAKKIKKKILKKFNLPCSMGIGPNMFLAKVAMDIEGKKKGLVEWDYEDIPEKLWPVKLSKCWGIGKRLERRLNKIGVKTVGELAHLPQEYLEKKFGIMGTQLYNHAWGVDLSRVEGEYEPEPKNLGRGITLFSDYKSEEKIKIVIFELCEEVAKRTREHNLLGKTISLGIQYSHEELEGGFRVQRTLNEYTNLIYDIYNVCLELFKENYRGQVVRKVQVSLGNFVSASSFQLNLFKDKVKEVKLAEVKDYIEKKYGSDAIFYGKSLKKGSIRERIVNNIGGHKR